MSSYDVRLPSLIGGLPTSFDVRPTIVMITLYTFLLPLCVLRMVQPSSRNVVQLAISAQIVERIINLTIRLLQSLEYKGWVRERTLLLEYQQITLGWGWIALAQSLAPLLRSLMVNATRRPLDRRSMNGQAQLPQSHHSADQKIVRTRIRRAFYLVDLLYWVANLLGLGAYVVWRHAFEEKKAGLRKTMDILRYTSVILGIVLVLFNVDYALWARRKMRRIDPTGCLYLVGIWLFLLVIPIYRLTQFPITSIISDPPSFGRILNPLPISLPDDGNIDIPDTEAAAFDFPTSTTKAKIFFYIFHLAPEWIAAAIIIGTNTRRKFGTGAWGDRDWSWRAGWAVSRAVGWGHGRPWMKDPTDVKMVEVKRFSYEGSANFGEEIKTEKEHWTMMKDSKAKRYFNKNDDSDDEDTKIPPKHDFEISNEALTINCPSPTQSVHQLSAPPSPSLTVASPFSLQMQFRQRPSEDSPPSPVTRLSLPITGLSSPEPVLVDGRPRAFRWFRKH